MILVSFLPSEIFHIYTAHVADFLQQIFTYRQDRNGEILSEGLTFRSFHI